MEKTPDIFNNTSPHNELPAYTGVTKGIEDIDIVRDDKDMPRISDIINHDKNKSREGE
jgi:hypothetical protein